MRLPLVIGVLIAVMTSGERVDAEPPARETAVDNASVRVNLVTYPPGSGDGRHMGVEPELGIVVDGEVTLQTPRGRETIKTGRVYWVPGMTPHDLRNETDRAAKVWMIFLKRW